MPWLKDGSYRFVYSDGTNDFHKELMNKMGLTNDDLPTIRAFDPREPYHHFKFDEDVEELNLNSLLNFVIGVTSGGATTIKLIEPFMPLQN